MEHFDLKNLTPEMCAEIKACESTEALNAYFASKNIAVTEDKLEAIATMAGSFSELSMEDLEAVSGGCCWCDDDKSGCNWQCSDGVCHCFD